MTFAAALLLSVSAAALTYDAQSSVVSSPAEFLSAIRDPDDRHPAGITGLGAGETVWRFVPVRPWRGGRYAIVVHPDLEDVAGNGPCARFEVIDASRVRCEAF